MRSGTAILGVFLVVGALPALAQREECAPQVDEIYRHFCMNCHGPYGRGETSAAAYLTVKPPDFTDSTNLSPRSVEQIAAELTAKERSADEKPHSFMVIGGVLSEENLNNAIAYTKALAVPGKHVSLLAGRDIFNATCWVCHGRQGEGNGPAAKNVTDAKVRNFRSPEFVFEGGEDAVYRAISEGAAKAFHGSPYMPEWDTAFSPQQIRDVMAYINSFKQHSE
jgi:mono/diheme cytochrome c family protein